MKLTRFGIVVLVMVGLAVLARFGSLKMASSRASAAQGFSSPAK